MNKENLNENVQPKHKYADLEADLGFDLSFLDDIDESVVETPAPKKSAPKAPAKKAAPVQAAPEKKATPVSEKKAAPAKKPVFDQDAPVKKAAPAQKPAPKKQPAAEAEMPKKKKKKKGPRLGGVIFYTIYFMFIFAFFVATFFALRFVNGWLLDFEAAQPTHKAEQVFTQLFTDPDWGALYESAGAQDSPYEGKEEYVNYMEAKVGSAALNYMETSAGLSGDKKFIIRLGDEKVASFTLVDKNNVGDASLDNLGEIPDWQLGSVEVFFERVGDYLIEKVDGHVAYVNNVPLDDSFTIQIATTLAAEEYLAEGTTGVSVCTQKITGLMEKPEVVIFDKDGNQMEVTYDEASRTFIERTESNTMTDEQKDVALEASKTYSLWMIEEVTDRAKIAKYFDATAKPYKDIVTLGELWMQGHAGYAFKNESVTKFASYGEDMFSVYVSLDLVVTRKDATEKTYDFDKTLFFTKLDGKWKVTDWTNVDVSQPIGKVRLTFMDGNTELLSKMFQNDIDEIITPVINAPAGQVFAGWVRQDVAEDGTTTLTVVFQPDETGTVSLPDGHVLEPMTLYAYFEDASSAAAADAAVPETTEGA